MINKDFFDKEKTKETDLECDNGDDIRDVLKSSQRTEDQDLTLAKALAANFDTTSDGSLVLILL